MTEAQKRLIEKLKALADKGVGGEKINAENKLKRLLGKLNLTIEDITDSTKKVRIYGKPRDENKVDVINHVIRSFLNDWDTPIQWICGRKKYFKFEATNEEYVELIARIEFYLNQFDLKMKALTTAFIIKNDLARITTDSSKTTKLNEEEKLLMMSLNKSHYLKQLECN